MYSEQIQNRDNYSKLERTVCINILNFKYLKNDKYHNAYRLKEITSNEELTDLQEIHFIELPKFNEIGNKEYVENVEKMDALEKWLEFLVEPESKLEVVKESLSQGLEISLISKITGLSEEEILKIKKDI